MDNASLVKRIAGSLAPGGRLYIKDFLLDADRTTPAWSALFGLQMLVSTDGGDCYTVDEVRGWLDDAGLVLEGVSDLTPQSRLAVARRP